MQGLEEITNVTGRSLYEAVPYPHYVFPQTSPDNLSVVSTLYGLNGAAASRCRYLELGCGKGTNIAAFASRYPDSRFVGIDLAENHIISAKQMANELGLQNTEFIAGHMKDVDPSELGQFDFVVAHGLFSWVPEVVRARILELMKRCIAPQGVGYISYNAFPGCYIRQIGWDLLRFFTRHIEEPLAKIEAAKDLAGFVARESLEGSPQQSIFQLIDSGIAARRIENILHDDLSELNRPFYFFEFAELLASTHLKFLCEADPRSSGAGRLSVSASNPLVQVSSGPIEREQLADFLDFTSFRQSVICHAEAQSRSEPSPDSLRNLICRWTVQPTSVEAVSDSSIAIGFDDVSLETDHPLTAKLLSETIRSNPAPLNIGNAIVSSNPHTDADIQRTLQFLLDLYRGGFLRLFAEQPPIDFDLGERPRVNVFARWQAMNGLDTFATLLGENIQFGNELVRQLVVLLNGTRNRNEAMAELLDRLEIPPDQMAQARSSIPEVVNSNIDLLRQLGVFVR